MPDDAQLPLAMPLRRRSVLAGALAAGGGLLLLPGCATTPRYSLEDAVRRMLFLASERAFVRMLGPGGYWDDAVANVGLAGLIGARGTVMANILTSTLFKERLEDALADIAFDAADRAAPLVTDAVRVIGFQNAVALIAGGADAATVFLRGQMGERLVEAMVPEVGEALRIAREPLVREALAGLAGVDVAAIADRFAETVDDTIWREIGAEEAAIRRDPQGTGDPVLIGVLGAAGRI